jgi:hypothetical protein
MSEPTAVGTRRRTLRSSLVLGHTHADLIVSLHERFSLARRNCGFPHGITLILTYPSAAELPPDTALSTRIAELQEHFPLLRARIVGARTRTPSFALRDVAWAATDVLHHETFAPLEDATEEMEHILYAETMLMEDADLDAAPMWRVAVLAAPGAARAYVAVSTNHEITDGLGLLALAHALLAPSIADLPYEALDKIPRLEDTISLKPGVLHLLSVAWAAYVVPFLPAFLRPVRPWPAINIAKPPMECPRAISLLALAPSLVRALKTAGVAHGVPALHATLKLAFGLAIWAIFQDTMEPFTLNLGTPRSERSSELGHAHCTGNYVSSYDTLVRPASHTEFWEAAAPLAADLRSPAGIALARAGPGMLAYVPDPEPDPAARDTRAPTGWERTFLARAEGVAPYAQALNLSNLGCAALQPGAVDGAWGQSASPFGPVLGACALGHDAGLRITTVWREGAAVTRAEVKEVERVLVRVLERLGDGQWKGTTFGELVSE